MNCAAYKTMKKRRISIGCILALLIGLLAPPTFSTAASEDILILMMLQKNKVYTGEIQLISQSALAVPQRIDHTIVVPLRFVAETLNAKVEFDESTREIWVTGNSHILQVRLDSAIITVDGTDRTLSTSVRPIDGVTMIALQPFVEGLGYKAFWNNKGVIVVGSEQCNPYTTKDFIDEKVFELYGERYWNYSYEQDYVPITRLREQLQFQTITKDMMKAAIESQGLITNEVHPSLLFTRSDIERIKQQIQEGDPFLSGMHQQLMRTAGNLMLLDLPVYALDEAQLRVADLHSWQCSGLVELGLAYQLTGDEKYAQRAYEYMEAFAAFDDWGYPKHFLDGGVGGTYISIAYDLIWETLTKQQRETIQDALVKHCVNPGIQGVQKPEWWYTGYNNWTTICMTGVQLAALMNYNRDPDTYAQLIADCMKAHTQYIAAFEPMGQTEEGESYFHYGVSFLELALQACMKTMGTDFEISQTNGMRKAGWFPLRVSGTSHNVSIGDDALKVGTNDSRLFFAKWFQDIPLAKLIYEQIARKDNYEWRYMLFYDQEQYNAAMNSGEVAMPQLDNYIPELEIISFRSNWTTKGNFVSIHSGRGDAAHGHLDAGQIDIQAGGVKWIYGSLGSGDYQQPGWFDATFPTYEGSVDAVQLSPGRNHIYKIRTEGKSALVIKSAGEPDIRQEQSDDGVPIVEKIVSKPKGGFAIVDLQDSYRRDVKSYKRGILLSADRKVITVQDELETVSDQSVVYWFAHTPAFVSIGDDGKTALLEKDGQRMYVEIASPANATFYEMGIEYLPGEEFPLSVIEPAPGIKKLAIRLENVGKTTISVNFIPLDAGKLEPDVKAPALREMSKWAIEEGPISLPNKPQLDEITVNGEKLIDFQRDYYSYVYSSVLPVDSTELPEITAKSSHSIEYKKVENTMEIIVTDQADITKQSTYYIQVHKNGAPTNAAQLHVRSAVASDTPEPHNPVEKLFDGDLDPDSRWSSLGNQWAIFDLGESRDIHYLGMAVFKGHERNQAFKILVSEDKNNWAEVYNGQSSGLTQEIEYFSLKKAKGRYVKFEGFGNSVNEWNSIVEIKLYGE